MWRGVLLLCACAGVAPRFSFYRSLRRVSHPTRRVFGGRAAGAGAYPPACALLDRELAPRCSGAVLAPRWALTAAHCAAPDMAYIKYNVRSADNADFALIHVLYRHPNYRVVEGDEGSGLDVLVLHNDIGLVRTRSDMRLAPPTAPRASPRVTLRPAPPQYDPNEDPIGALALTDATQLLGRQIDMLGFGRTTETPHGVELRVVALRAASCLRRADAWRYCGCGEGDAAGVCEGDSGGPVLYRGRQVGVTVMGPVECAPRFTVSAFRAPVVVASTSVFTAVQPYVGLINDTIHGVGARTRMQPVEYIDIPTSSASVVICGASDVLYAVWAALGLCSGRVSHIIALE